VLCTALLLPFTGALERLVTRLVPDAGQPERAAELDERLLLTPPIALARCRAVASDMAKTAVEALREGMTALCTNSPALAASVREREAATDHYEDILGTYLVRLSGRPVSEADSKDAAKLLKLIGDFERISDHAVGLVESAEEMREKKLEFSPAARAELAVISAAVEEILSLSLTAFLNEDLKTAAQVEPLEQVIDRLKETLRTRHILRLQQGACSMEVGFVWTDLLTHLARTADHCSNIAACLLDIAQNSLHPHATLRTLREENDDFHAQFAAYSEKYAL
jgi:phosphate:Na+ symporter